MPNKDHPVWDVYDKYRTARLNVKYYSSRLHRLNIASKTFDITLAITAPSSAISGLFLFDIQFFAQAWKWFGAASAVIAFLKPFLKLGDSIKKHEEYLSGYRSYFLDLDKLKLEISQKRSYNSMMKSRFMDILEKRKVLFESTPDLQENKRLKRRLDAEVRSEYPVDSFYIP